MIDQEITHNVTDAKTQKVVPFIIQQDLHGMTVELPSGDIITLDLSGGMVSVYHSKSRDDVGEPLVSMKAE